MSSLICVDPMVRRRRISRATTLLSLPVAPLCTRWRTSDIVLRMPLMLLDAAVDLREPLLEHVQGFTEAQRQHVAGTVMEVLYNVPPKEGQAAEGSAEPAEA